MLFKVRFLHGSCNSPKPKMASNTSCWLICDGILDTAVAPLLPSQTNNRKLFKTTTIVASVKALNLDFGATKCCLIEWFHVVSPVSKCYPNLVPKCLQEIEATRFCMSMTTNTPRFPANPFHLKSRESNLGISWLTNLNTSVEIRTTTLKLNNKTDSTIIRDHLLYHLYLFSHQRNGFYVCVATIQG